LLHYRDQDQYEVDLVLENEAGDIVGIEVKAAASVQAKDLRGLQRLAGLAQTQFKLGVVLYDGTQTLPLGNGLWAAPLSTLWGNPSMG
jgi:predicted AAA+ superfamily ATPase